MAGLGDFFWAAAAWDFSGVLIVCGDEAFGDCGSGCFGESNGRFTTDGEECARELPMGEDELVMDLDGALPTQLSRVGLALGGVSRTRKKEVIVLLR